MFDNINQLSNLININKQVDFKYETIIIHNEKDLKDVKGFSE